MARLPIRPIIVVEANPKEVQKNDVLRLSARLFDKNSLALMKVSKIYMTITSLKDGHTVWPLEVIRKDASGFDIAIGTLDMKEGHEYLVRVSNNLNLSPSASVTFSVKEAISPNLILIPLIFSPLFVKKYQDKGITDVQGLVAYLKEQGLTDQQIQEEVRRITKEVELEEEIRIPVDTDSKVVEKKWITQMDTRVCKFCELNSHSGPNNDGVWRWDDPNAPDIPEHPRCRCTWDLRYERSRDNEFRAAAIMADISDLEMPLEAIKVIQNLP